MGAVAASPLLAFGPVGWALFAVVVVATVAVTAYEVEHAMESANTTFSDSAASAIQSCGRAIAAPFIVLMAALEGKKIRGLTGQIAIHLARILGTTVSGKPPDHQQDPKRDRPHWWKEIKNWIKQIKDKGLSDRQLLRELREGFSEEEIAEIREALKKAAEEMGEDPPDFPPAATP